MKKGAVAERTMAIKFSAINGPDIWVTMCYCTTKSVKTWATSPGTCPGSRFSEFYNSEKAVTTVRTVYYTYNHSKNNNEDLS
jgi:hypothetical protein